MTGSDDEFEDFLNRRKPVFRRPTDETFEPPAELDRVVLRQAREAIQPPEPMRMFSAPRWSMPIALAATLVLAFTVIFKAGMPPSKPAPIPEVTVQNAADRVDSIAGGAVQQPQEITASSGNEVVDLAQPAQARREMAPAPPAEPMVARSVADATSRRAGASSTMDTSAETAADPVQVGRIPVWRRDPKSWQAEIQRLRDAGDSVLADAEYAEFKRQQRAYAVAPDR